MTQSFHISDALRCILLNAPRGPNLVCSKNVCSPNKAPLNASLWKNVLTQRRDRVTLAWWQGVGLGGLVSAKMRSGCRAWEIDHLYLPWDSSHTSLGGNANHGYANHANCQFPADTAAPMELLEQVVQSVGLRSGERIFLRLPQYSPVASLAQRQGFFPCYQGTLMEGAGGVGLRGQGTPPPHLRDRAKEDAFGLFQLFSASTPVNVREALGLTFDHWQDAHEVPSHKGQQWVVEHRGRITGWLRLVQGGTPVSGEMMVHPDHPDLLPSLLSVALARPGIQRWSVPDYQERLARHLEDSGFHKLAQYTMLIKTVAVPVTRPGMAPAEA